jgi:hypothetical protein
MQSGHNRVCGCSVTLPRSCVQLQAGGCSVTLQGRRIRRPCKELWLLSTIRKGGKFMENQETENIRESLELISRAKAALEKIEILLAAMRTLADKAATEEAADRVALNVQFESLKRELMDTIGEADYGGINRLDGSLGSLEEATSAIEQALGIAGEEE